jgi:hypothetical protein
MQTCPGPLFYAAQIVALSFQECALMLSKVFPVAVSRCLALMAVALVLFQVPLGVVAQGIKDAEGTEESAANQENGLVGDGEYVSPQFGGTVEWGDHWSPNVEETVSNPGAGRDQLRLNWDGPSGNIFVTWLEEGRGGPPDDVAYWTSDEFFTDAYAQVDETKVLLEEPGSANGDGAVLIGLADAGDPRAYIHYAQSVPTADGGALYMVLDAAVESWPKVLESARESVTVDGTAPFDVFDEGDIGPALADAPNVPYTEEGAGLVDDVTYDSPAFGYELTWPDSWGLSHTIRYPVLSKAVVQFDEAHIADFGSEADPPPFFDFYATYPRESTIAQEAAFLVDPDWVSQGFRQEVEVSVLLQETSDTAAESLVAITFAETGEIQYAWFRFARDGDRSDLYFYLKARDDDFAAAWETMTNGEIALDGDAIDTMITWDAIEAAIADFEE